MKALTEKKSRTAANAWGRDDTVQIQVFEVEPKDIGQVREHYLGMHHRSHVFRVMDVGQQIEVVTAPGYTSWSFLTNPVNKE